MKSVLLYLLLVGIPVAGVATVLRAGRTIVPPPYVGGTWRLTMAPDSLCRVDPPDSLHMLVEQSGPHIVVTFNDSAKTRLKGRAYGVHFRVSDAELSMHAAVKRGTDSIRGSLVGIPCQAARRSRFWGRRILAPNESGAH
jgi:hypothetical protein